MIEKPIFLVGCERSGSTLLRLMLDHHPQISFQFEFEYAVDHITDDAFPELDAYRRRLQTHRIFQQTNVDLDPALNYPQLVNSFLEQKMRREGKPIVGATVHHDFRHLRRIWPGARFIHLVRDPRDVARSVVILGWVGNVWEGSQRWLKVEREWDHLKDTLEDGAHTEIHYEDLIADSHAHLDRLCRFMGVKFDEAMFDYAEKTTYQRPDPALMSQWKKKMSTRQIRLVESCAADMLEKRGYALSGHDRLAPGPLHRMWLRADSRIGRARFRIHKYGRSVYVQDVLARRLGMTGWHRRALRRINEIDNKHLR